MTEKRFGEVCNDWKRFAEIITLELVKWLVK